MQPGRVWCRVVEARMGARWGPCCAVLLLCACASVSQTGNQSALMQATNTKTSALQVRATQNMLALRLPGIFETAADAISAQATDPALRRGALLWKMEVVPAFYQALFNPDPLAATLDTLALCIQLDQYLEAPEVQKELAPLQSIAIQAAKHARRLAEDEMRLMATPAGFERALTVMDRWARAHPITGPLSSRPSPLGYLADLVAAAGKDVSVFQAVGDIPATVGDIATRLDIYSAYLPKAVRWQAELLGDELRDQRETERMLAAFVSVQQAADRFNQLLSPDAVKQALAQLQKERAAALSTVDTLRQQTQAYVTSEREAALAAVDMERRTVMEDVDKQRAALVQEVDSLRKQVRLDADELASRIIWRSALAAACLLILAATLSALVLRQVLKARA
jgi:hypothetical protein